MAPTIEVSAVVIRNFEGRVLNVRKRGTEAFMLPGGKPEAGEDPRDTAIREFHEELGVELDPLKLSGLGDFRAAAANEAGFEVLAHVYEHPYVEVNRTLAEIEELAWVDPENYDHATMAPLNTDFVFPALNSPERSTQRITVFTGSALGNAPVFAEQARTFGAGIASAGIGIVYGGGGLGLMATVADGALEAGGEVVGVITEALLSGETGHSGLTRLEVVPDMSTRKRRMAELTDAFVALPGGPGTLEELFEVWTWMTLGIHSKPVALLNVDGYWNPLLDTIDTMVSAGFSTQTVRDSLIVATNVPDLLAQLEAWQPPRPKWS